MATIKTFDLTGTPGQLGVTCDAGVVIIQFGVFGIKMSSEQAETLSDKLAEVLPDEDEEDDLDEEDDEDEDEEDDEDEEE